MLEYAHSQLILNMTFQGKLAKVQNKCMRYKNVLVAREVVCEGSGGHVIKAHSQSMPKLCLTHSVRMDRRKSVSFHLHCIIKKMTVGSPVHSSLPQMFVECLAHAAPCMQSTDSVTSSDRLLLSCHSGLGPNLCWQREGVEDIIFCSAWRDTAWV